MTSGLVLAAALLTLTAGVAEGETLQSQSYRLESGTWTGVADELSAADGSPRARTDLGGNASYGVSTSASGRELVSGFAVVTVPETSSAAVALAVLGVLRRRARV